MNHPWKILIEEIRSRDLTQKAFSLMLWKKVSELNELIKWKRNITIQWDILLSNILWTPEKFWIHKQVDYDYFIAKENFVQNKSLLENTKTNKKTLETQEKETINKNKIEPIWDNISLIEQKTQEKEPKIEHAEPKIEETKQVSDLWYQLEDNDLEELNSKELPEINIDYWKNQDIENKKTTEFYIDEEPDFDNSPEIDALDNLDDITSEDDVLEKDENSQINIKNKNDKDQENIFINF